MKGNRQPTKHLLRVDRELLKFQADPVLCCINSFTFKKQTKPTKPKETPYIEGSWRLAAQDAVRFQHAAK